MSIYSHINSIIGLARDFHKHINAWKRQKLGTLGFNGLGPAWKNSIISNLRESGYFQDVAIENYAEALVLLMETSDPRPKKKE